jgi:hypothetical protein
VSLSNLAARVSTHHAAATSLLAVETQQLESETGKKAAASASLSSIDRFPLLSVGFVRASLLAKRR